jgi:hypothetical protein
VLVTGWSVTTAFAEAAVRTGRYPRLRHLPNAIVRGALLLDLALARLVTPAGRGLHASAPQSGFPPADRLLGAIVVADAADLGQLVWRAPVGMEQVIAEFVSRGWWERAPAPWWRRRPRYRPTDLISAGVRDPKAEQLVRVMMALFDGTADTDAMEADVQAEADAGRFGPASWLAPAVLHELVELRSWLDAVGTMPQTTGGG